MAGDEGTKTDWREAERWMELPGLQLLLRDGVMKVRNRTACFDLKSFSVDGEAGEGDRLGEVLSCLALLKDAVGRHHSEGPAAWRPTVGVAGSAALCLVERLMAQDPQGRWRARWKARARQGGANLIWNPNDVDVFLCGRPGSRRASFRAAVQGICRSLSERLARTGKQLIVEEEFEHRYTLQPDAFLIQNVRVEGMETVISFIQVPGREDVTEVMESFDMDIVRCMCNIERQELCVPVKVASRIWKGQAEVVDFVTKLQHPTQVEERAICSTLRRMRKYGERGYTFVRYFQIRSGSEEWLRNRGAHAEGMRRQSQQHWGLEET